LDAGQAVFSQQATRPFCDWDVVSFPSVFKIADDFPPDSKSDLHRIAVLEVPAVCLFEPTGIAVFCIMG
jgi:hypothetical protein